MSKGRKRKLDTPEEIETVCFLYYHTDSNMSQIARHFEVSWGIIDRVLRENGLSYQKERECQ